MTTKSNISFSIGNLALMNKADNKYNFFGSIFQGLAGKTKREISHPNFN